MSYTKLYSTILDSSVWSASDSTRLVWVTMLAMATKNGIVHASVDGLARRAQVSLEKTEIALTELSAPDRHDKSGVLDGRRIIPMQGCWQLINFEFYREARSIDAIRKQQWRGRAASKKAHVLDNAPSSSSSSSSSSAPAPAPAGGGECEGSAKAAPSPAADAAPSPQTKRSRARTSLEQALANGFMPNNADRACAIKHGVDMNEVWPQFCDHHRGKGTLAVDWNATLRTWIRNEAKFARAQNPKAKPRTLDEAMRDFK